MRTVGIVEPGKPLGVSERLGSSNHPGSGRLLCQSFEVHGGRHFGVCWCNHDSTSTIRGYQFLGSLGATTCTSAKLPDLTREAIAPTHAD